MSNQPYTSFDFTTVTLDPRVSFVRARPGTVSGAVFSDTSATIPTVDQMRIGSDGSNYLNGHIASIGYYDRFSSQIYTRLKNKAVFSLL